MGDGDLLDGIQNLVALAFQPFVPTLVSLVHLFHFPVESTGFLQSQNQWARDMLPNPPFEADGVAVVVFR